MKPYHNLRDYLAALKQRGELVIIDRPVSTRLEITEIAERTFKKTRRSPALLFTNVTDHTMPVAINLFGTEERTAMALGVQSLDDIGGRIAELTRPDPPKNLMAKIKKGLQFASVLKNKPRLVKEAPVQEVVLTGDAVNLHRLPVLTCWPDDGGPFITLTAVVSKDPQSGLRNIGMYRVQVFDEKTAGLHWQRHKGGAAHHEKYRKTGGKMEVAVVLGGDPATIYSASAPLPPVVDEWFFSGFLRKKPVDLVKCKTVDLEVPAQAEIVLEGYVDLNEPLRIEGPFGDHTGYYSLADYYPAFHVTAITMRKDAIYPTTIVGVPPVEDEFLGKITERAFLPLMQVVLPEVRDYHLPTEGVFHNLVFISARKSYPAHAWKILHGANGLGLMMLSKVMIVVDEQEPVTDPAHCWKLVMKHVHFKLDVALSRGPIDALDHASQYFTYAGKLLIDATRKWDGEGRSLSREPEVAVSASQIEEITSRLLAIPGVKQIHWPYLVAGQSGSGSPLFIKIEKSVAGEGQRVLDAVLSLQHTAGLNRFVIVVDDVEDLTNPYDCWWIALNNLDPLRDVVFKDFPLQTSGYRVPGYYPTDARMGWDSTTKWPSEGFTREWPWKVKMDEAVSKKIDEMWPTLGIE